MKNRCVICNYVYDEEREGVKFTDLPDEWRCKVCNSSKANFVTLSKEAEDIEKKESTVSDILVQQMVEWGIEYVFGIPGTSSLGVVDAVRKNKNIKYIQVRHEQSAAFMASAYGKLTGNVAVCLTIAGPGATNLATGLYDAKLDHSPVLALTGMVKRQMIGPGSFQEIDQHSFFESVTVYNETLMSKKQTISLITLAIKHAIVDRGVAHLGIPNDVQKENYFEKTVPFEGSFPNRAVSPPKYVIMDAASVIERSERPVIVVGFGAAGQEDNIIKIAEKVSAPIVSTYRGKGVVDGLNELYVGSHGGIGSLAAAKLVRDSDLLIVIGSSFADLTNLPKKKIIQIDMDPMMIGKTYPVEVGLLGNSAEIVPKLLDTLKENKKEDYLDEIRTLRTKWLKQLEDEIETNKAPIRPQYIIKALNDRVADDAVITLDVGENGWWPGRNFIMKSTQKLILSGYLGSMGFGLPAALAAQLIYQDKQIICIAGDGGFAMTMADFMTAVKYNLPVKVFIFNNGELAMIKQEQKVEGYENWATDLHDFNFADYAQNCGGVGIRVEKPEELENAVDEAMALNKPVIVDINTDPVRFGN
ncbi:thiamine pyrophosphate-dependent enzyme [Methanobacterium sp. ACI-7]|uniref:thiamine pyrophosphate-dependent enzyme n=1 Tax=unclassified Methanobacterium TaxID=2627676 RepID=UPI0039C150CA